ncbi:MAG TPA: type II toxin-antitoxin system prevent-host-death family antitoxin [Thermoanaerobaculia bacterium]|jgi:prevent-host-death family protein|nr:type II toxin-antitoxin system prevent-host-death family antitoxin [Thermoanaerobaculia bacterium]
MAESITQRDLRNNSGEIMRRLDQGESFIVTRNGVPVGEFTPLRRHRFVPAAAVVAIFRNAPAIDPGRFRADVDAWAGQDDSTEIRLPAPQGASGTSPAA